MKESLAVDLRVVGGFLAYSIGLFPPPVITIHLAYTFGWSGCKTSISLTHSHFLQSPTLTLECSCREGVCLYKFEDDLRDRKVHFQIERGRPISDWRWRLCMRYSLSLKTRDITLFKSSFESITRAATGNNVQSKWSLCQMITGCCLKCLQSFEAYGVSG